MRPSRKPQCTINAPADGAQTGHFLPGDSINYFFTYSTCGKKASACEAGREGVAQARGINRLEKAIELLCDGYAMRFMESYVHTSCLRG